MVRSAIFENGVVPFLCHPLFFRMEDCFEMTIQHNLPSLDKQLLFYY